jgi:RNA polymerase sigma-70 factor, ECF subfamily
MVQVRKKYFENMDKVIRKPELAPISDIELVTRVQKGSKADFQQLVERYQDRALTVAFQILRSHEDAQDVVQESFVKAYLSINSFQGNSSFFTWFYRILVNMAIDFRRRIGRKDKLTLALDIDERDTIEQQVDNSLISQRESQLDSVLRVEQAKQIDQALAQISEDHRAVIVLREVEGLRYEEIADTLGVSKGTVMSRLFYARKRLQQVLTEMWNNEVSGTKEKVMNTNVSASSK